MKNKLTLVITMTVILFSGLVFADDYCDGQYKTCTENYYRDLAFCSTQGQGRENCEQRAKETFESCLNGC